jgi:hypothetical protein
MVAACAATLGSGVRTAHAEWRDGCPPVDEPRPRAGAFGRSGDLDTTLGGSRVEIRGAHVNLQRLSARTVRGHMHVQHRGGFFGAIGVGAADVVRLADERAGIDSRDRWYLGNVLGVIGYRSSRNFLGDTLRHGLSLKLGIGTSPWSSEGDEGAEHIAELNAIADRQPFATAVFAHDRPVLTGAETRVELIGCRGPYVRARADVIGWRPTISGIPRNASGASWAFPMSVASGGYMYSWMLVEFQAGIEPRHAGAGRRGEAYDFALSRTLRLGFFMDLQPSRATYWHLAVFADLFPRRTAGWQAGVALAVDFEGSFKRGDVLE